MAKKKQPKAKKPVLKAKKKPVKAKTVKKRVLKHKLGKKALKAKKTAKKGVKEVKGSKTGGKLSEAFLRDVEKYLNDRREEYFLTDELISSYLDAVKSVLNQTNNVNDVLEKFVSRFPDRKKGYNDENFNKRIYTDLACLVVSKEKVNEKLVLKLIEELINVLEFESKIPCFDEMDYDAKHEQMGRQVRNLRTLNKNELVEEMLKKFTFLKFFWDHEKTL